MTERAARLVLALAAAALLVAALAVDLPALSGRRFWGDGATYYAMAWSLARDGDLRYEARDLYRVKREYPGGPEGIILKRSHGGWAFQRGFPWVRRVTEEEKRIYFAKALAYPAFAAPFVGLFGTRGLLLANAVALGAALVLGYIELRRRMSAGVALAVVLVLFLGSTAPLYVLWPTPELFNLGLVVAGLVAWSRDRPVVSAVLLGIATYSKPYNLWLAVPLGLAPLVGRQWGEVVRRGFVLAAATAALFGLNAVITGEANYQGGAERKTFYGRFPGESPEVTFGNAGTWMTTNRAGPRVLGQDQGQRAPGEEGARSPGELRESFLRNLGYFWVGRFGGALAYFFAAVLAAALFLFVGPRDARGWLCIASLAVSYVFYLYMIPDNWYGGSGTLGNRYFLNLLPLAIFLVPRGREWIVAAAGAAGAAAFLLPMHASPLWHSLHPGAHSMRWPFRALPVELTMLNDLSVFEEVWRKKQPVGDTEGDAHKHWPADPRAYYLYFPDDGTRGKEALGGNEGFWLKRGQDAEVILRSLEPVERMALVLTGGAAGDDVTVRVGSAHARIAVGPGGVGQADMEPGRGFPYKDTFLYRLRLGSRARGTLEAEGTSGSLGAFVQVSLAVRKRSP